MSANFGYNIRTLANNNFLNNFRGFEFSQWESGKTYAIGDKVFNGGYRYVATSSGTSGVSGPSTSDSPVSDGGVNWIFLETISNTEIFEGNLYFFIGKLDEWLDQNQIPQPDISDNNSYVTINDMASLKRIEKSDMRLGIKYYPWVGNTIYSQYDPQKNPYTLIGENSINAYEYPFYCINNNKIYKCLNNNNGGFSTVPPTDTFTGTNLIVSADRYVWKYMGTIASSNFDFITNDYVPVSYLITDDGTDQWDVQNSVKNNSISSFNILDVTGTIDPARYTIKIFKDNIGKELYESNVYPNTTITVDNNSILTNIIAASPAENFLQNCIAIVHDNQAYGNGAYTYDSDFSAGEDDGKVTIENGEIISITFKGAQCGQLYDANSKIIIIGRFAEDAVTKREATASLIINSNTITGVTMIDVGSGYEYARAFVIPGVSGNSGIGGGVADVILAPKNGHGYNMAKELGANALIVRVETPTGSPYFEYGENNKFRQFGIITDIKIEDETKYASELLYIGPRHSEYNLLTSTLNKISKNYGDILYLNNFGEILRENSKSEKIKVTIIF